jgi:cell division protein DivIC
LVYHLFLDDLDLFTLVGQRNRLNALHEHKAIIDKDLKNTRRTLKQLNHLSEVERYAREKKYFKKDNEDVFVIH